MGEEVGTTVSITREQVEQYKELQKIMTSFRKSLGPRKEELFNAVVENVDITEVLELAEVSGGNSISVSGEVEGQKVTIMFRFGN